MPSIAYLDFKYERTSTVNKIYDNAITLTALVDDCQIGFYVSDQSYIYLSISYDNGMTWTDIHLPGESNFYYPDPIDTGQTIMIAGRENHHNYGCKGLHIFSEEDNYFNVSGNLTSLLDSDISLVEREWPLSIKMMNNCFDNLFGTFTNSNTTYRAYIKDASGLIFPDLKPASYMYARMFRGCTSLETAPVTLTTHANNSSSCYGMFEGCTSLTTAPKLPATKLAYGCYQDMFRECTSLTVAPELPATSLAMLCYQEMFKGCTSLTVAPRLNATTLEIQCYESMFEGCTSLTTAPELPATTLDGRCYRYMFKGCTSLTTAPELPATSLASECYTYMFEDCENLNYIKILATSWPANTYLEDHITGWVTNVAHTGTFVKDINTTYEIDSDSGVPIGWTVYNTGEYIPQNYTVSLIVNPDDSYGTVSGAGTYQGGTLVTIMAAPSDGYIFTGWVTPKGTTVSTDPTYTFTITRNERFAAYFEVAPVITYYDVLLFQNPIIGATLTGNGVYADGDTATVTASNVEGYNFIGWYLDNERVSSSNTYSFTVTNTVELTAKYEVIPPEPQYYTVNVYNSYPDLGTVSGGGRYLEGTSVTITATPKPGCSFITWIYNGIDFSPNQSVTFTVTQDVDFGAKFATNYYQQYFTMEALESGGKFILNFRRLPSGSSIQVKYNNEAWITITSNSSLLNKDWILDINNGNTLNIGDKISLRRLYRGIYQSNEKYIMVGSTKKYAVYGNIASIYSSYDDVNNMTDTLYAGINLDTMNNNDTYRSLFECTDQYGTNQYGNQLIDASNLVLPFTTLADYAYQNMFGSCTELLYTPTLPATVLAYACYANMFSMCYSLKNAPALPATTMAQACYSMMFAYCHSLVNAPTLPATTLAQWCYEYMFFQCQSLTTAPALPATTLAISCYSNMFGECTSLTTAPALPATTLNDWCYSQMFSECTSLVNAPDLPATTLVKYCYQSMFSNCSSLNNIKCLATSINTNGATNGWMFGVSETGTFTKDPNATWSAGQDGIPTGWTVVDAR